MSKELNKCCSTERNEGCGCSHDHEEHKGCGDNCGCGHDHEAEHEGECGDDCGCGDHEDFVVDLENEDGSVVSCPIIDAFEFEENEYILAQNPEEDSVYLFRSTESGELEVPDEVEFDRVSAYYSELADESQES